MANAELGLSRAERLGVDRLIFANELVNPKIDSLALQTYIAQFRNIPNSLADAERIKASGHGLRDGIVNQPSNFNVIVPSDLKGKLTVFVEGPKDKAPVVLTPTSTGYDCSYTPTLPGHYVVHILYEGIHVPGSPFHVNVLDEESLGGEGKIRVFFSTTQSSNKGHADVRSLTSLLEAKKVHLRHDFEPWHAIDCFDRDDREAVFRKAGTRNLPIVFVDDKYIGDYDKIQKLEEEGKLDGILLMQGAKLISDEEHLARMQQVATAVGKVNIVEQKETIPIKPLAKAAVELFNQPAPTNPDAPKFCTSCGAARVNFNSKFCSEWYSII